MASVSRILLSLAVCASGIAQAQTVPVPTAPPSASPVPTAPPVETPAGQTPPAAPAASPPSSARPGIAVPAANGEPPFLIYALTKDTVSIFDANNNVHAVGGIQIVGQGITITADQIDGNRNTEFVFSGHAKVATSQTTAYADAIHFFPLTRSYRLDNPRTVLDPSVLEYRVLDPVYLTGAQLFGTRSGYTVATDGIATTCVELFHHYELRFHEAELYPHKRLILRRVAVYFFGAKLITLPTLVIPLDERARRFRTDYLPEFGQNFQEGYFARFPYVFAIGAAAATFLRLDVTQKKGFGYRTEQEYLAGKQDSIFNTTGSGGGIGGIGSSGGGGAYITAYGYGNLRPGLPRLGNGVGPQNGGLAAINGYFNEGFNRDFTASFAHQQSIGGDNRFAFSTELTRQSYLLSTSQTNRASRFDFTHADAAHGSNVSLNLGLTTSDSPSVGSSQLTGSLRQSFDFDSKGSTRNSFNYGLDVSRYLTDTFNVNGGLASLSRAARLDSTLQYQHAAREYNFTLQANKSTPVGFQSQAGSFGTLERLPELQLSSDTYSFRGGWLKQLPLHFDIGAGRYSEPSSNTNTERALLGVTLQDIPILRGRTEITMGGGFEQRVYGDGAEQYITRDSTRLRQHIAGRSGFDINYQYEQPEGGTPFNFDTYGRTHSLSAEGGYLDDRHFQLTARVGYDLLGSSQLQPWQSLSTRLMWRPTNSVRLDALTTYDPNTGRFFSITDSLRFRARNDFAVDFYTRYDPQQHKFSQINTQFDVPLGRTWRLAGLVRYNGFTHQIESQNFQLTHTWDCLEASLTYTQTPFSFNRSQQFYLTIRIKAFPFFRSFARGPAGESLGAGISDIY